MTTDDHSRIELDRNTPSTSVMTTRVYDIAARNRVDKFSLLSIELIELPENRLRPVDPEFVASLKADIAQFGLLQPIGVQRLTKESEHPGRFRVIFGAHRFMAYHLGYEETVAELMAIRAGRPVETLSTEEHAEERRRMWPWTEIACVIFPPGMAADALELREIEENLLRRELDPQEKQEFRARYTALIKRSSRKAAEIREERKKGASNNVAQEQEPNGSVLGSAKTTTEKAASDLGTTDDTLRNSLRAVADRGNAAAEALGEDAKFKITPEHPEQTDEAIAMTRKAEAAGHKVEKPKKAKEARAAPVAAKKSATIEPEPAEPEPTKPILAVSEPVPAQGASDRYTALLTAWSNAETPIRRLFVNQCQPDIRALLPNVS
ncbi:MAG TPA: ParB N-terminal domain-containing protein [Inquilinus sp.]